MCGPFITLEGIDGSGKSSLLPRVAGWLAQRGCTPVVVREPGGTPLGEALRELLLVDPRGEGMSGVTEVLLMTAARAELVRRVLRPALARGAAVVCDRFADSTVAYQGYGRGLDPAWIAELQEAACEGMRPDLTLLLDLPVEVAWARLGPQRLHRIGGEGLAFLVRVRQGYLALAAAAPERIKVLDASQDPQRVWQQVAAVLEAFWARRGEAAGGEPS